MRLFVAFELPAALREEIGRRTAELRPTLPPARWVRPEGLHLTLTFLGETDERSLPALGADLAPAFAAAPALTGRLAGGGGFPPGRPARVVWVGVGVAVSGAGGGDAGGHLVALQRRVDGAARGALGLAPERRPFSPHVTVARPQPPWPRAAVEAFAGRFAPPLSGALGEPFPLAAGTLIESVLGGVGGGGARYRTVDRFPLEA